MKKVEHVIVQRKSWIPAVLASFIIAGFATVCIIFIDTIRGENNYFVTLLVIFVALASLTYYPGVFMPAEYDEIEHRVGGGRR